MQFRVKMVGELEVEMETLMFFSWSSRNWGHMQNMVKHFIVCLRGKFGVLWIDSQEAYRYKVFRPSLEIMDHKGDRHHFLHLQCCLVGCIQGSDFPLSPGLGVGEMHGKVV